MAQTIQISQTKFDELLNRLSRLESMVNKVLEKTMSNDVPLVDQETEKMITQGMEDIKKGNYITLTTDEEIDKHFDSL